MTPKDEIASLQDEMHLLFTRDLVGLLRSKTASSADRSVIRQYMKDQNINAPQNDPHLAALAAAAAHADADDVRTSLPH